jgi:hypothetical protein
MAVAATAMLMMNREKLDRFMAIRLATKNDKRMGQMYYFFGLRQQGRIIYPCRGLRCAVWSYCVLLVACGSKEEGFVPAGGFAYAVWSYCVLLVACGSKEEGFVPAGGFVALFGPAVCCWWPAAARKWLIHSAGAERLRCLVLLCFVGGLRQQGSG